MYGFKTLATAFDLPDVIPPRNRVSVRQADERDLRAILAVEHGCEETTPYDEQCVRRVVQTPGLDCCVGKIGYAIVGWGVAVHSGEDIACEIGRLVVLPGFRRAGVGRAILGHLINAAFDGDVSLAAYCSVRATLSERNTGGLCFLRDCGFRRPVIIRDWFDKDEHAIRQFYQPFEGPITGLGGMTQ